MAHQKKIEFDVVIPFHKKDIAVLEYCIEAAKKKIIGSRRIIVISKEKYTNNAEWLDEKIFPFSLALVSSYVGASAGWYFQQLLKLYAPLVIQGISENILVLDSDTVFFRKVRMFDKNGLPFFNISNDKTKNQTSDNKFAKHAETLLPSISSSNLPFELRNVSGISHHMIFNKYFILELFKKIEDHDGNNDPFYKIFLKHASKDGAASEYHLYFCFVLINHAQEIKLRKLRYKNTADFNIRKYKFYFRYHYCSFHSDLQRGKKKYWHKKIINIFTKLFFDDSWKIGVVKCNIAEFLKIPNQEVHWLKNGGLFNFSANPFGFIDKSGNKNIFFEKYSYFKRKGDISRLRIDSDFEVFDEAQALAKIHHLSYPYIFCDKDQRFMMIEGYKSNRLELYKIKENLSLEKVKDLIFNKDIVDPSIVKYNDKWWLFFTLNSHGDSKLFLAYSDDLFGKWTMHKNNPVKNDIASARCGGEIFQHDGFLYRPSQNCKNSYGSSLKINKIIALNAENYQEEAVAEIHPNQSGPCPHGLHHISTLGKDLTLIDGKRKAFIFYKPLISIFRICHKIWESSDK